MTDINNEFCVSEYGMSAGFTLLLALTSKNTSLLGLRHHLRKSMCMLWTIWDANNTPQTDSPISYQS